jgi:tRNA-specific 2-thiouridylase
MKVLVALSGGVDSTVAAALLQEQGHEIAGVTLKLWGGDSDSGCCSVADVDDARRVAQQLGIRHYVFNFGEEFDANVVDPYVRAHSIGETPNPCVECNRFLKFDRLLHRATQLGFEAIATGHHVRRITMPDGRFAVGRGFDDAKDQSYVVHMLGQDVLARTLFPVGDLTKTEVRAKAAAMGLRTAGKAESMEVCFIAETGGGRRVFLGERIPLRPAKIVDVDGTTVGQTDAVELVTIGQRRNLGLSGAADRRYVVDIDVANAVVTVGDRDALRRDGVTLHTVTLPLGPALLGGTLRVQTSAHGRPVACTAEVIDDRLDVTFAEPQTRVAPGQSVVLYATVAGDVGKSDVVVAGGIASRGYCPDS